MKSLNKILKFVFMLIIGFYALGFAKTAWCLPNYNLQEIIDKVRVALSSNEPVDQNLAGLLFAELSLDKVSFLSIYRKMMFVKESAISIGIVHKIMDSIPKIMNDLYEIAKTTGKATCETYRRAILYADVKQDSNGLITIFRDMANAGIQADYIKGLVGEIIWKRNFEDKVAMLSWLDSKGISTPRLIMDEKGNEVFLMLSSEAAIAIPQRINHVVICCGATSEAVAAIPQHVKIVEIFGGATPETVAAIPQHVEIIGICLGATPEAVAAIPQHVKIVEIHLGTVPEAVAAIPQPVKIVEIFEGVTPETVAAIPQHVEIIGICLGATPEAVAAIPQHVKIVEIHLGTVPEAVAAIPQPVKIVGIYLGVAPADVAAMPQHVRVVEIFGGVTPETVAAIPQHVEIIGICLGATPEAVAAIPQHVKAVRIFKEVTPETAAAIPHHIGTAMIPFEVSAEVFNAVPQHITKDVELDNVIITPADAMPQHVYKDTEISNKRSRDEDNCSDEEHQKRVKTTAEKGSVVATESSALMETNLDQESSSVDADVAGNNSTGSKNISNIQPREGDSNNCNYQNRSHVNQEPECNEGSSKDFVISGKVYSTVPDSAKDQRTKDMKRLEELIHRILLSKDKKVAEKIENILAENPDFDDIEIRLILDRVTMEERASAQIEDSLEDYVEEFILEKNDASHGDLLRLGIARSETYYPRILPGFDQYQSGLLEI